MNKQRNMNLALSYRLHYKKVAVLGDGVMGSQIAVHLANCRIPTILYCTVPIEKEKQATYRKELIKRITKLKPAALAHPDFINDIEILFLEEAADAEKLKSCDLLIEAIIEQLDAKKALYQKIAPLAHNEAIIASNTSGLSIASLSDVLPDTFASRFCGIHFFNPVRYLPLCELIPLPAVSQDQIETLIGFLTSILGKRVVLSKDSPAFIGNRLGLFCVLATFKLAEKHGLHPDLIDELTGTLIAHASSATFRTADIVGLDVLAFVANNMKDNLADDPWHSYFPLPDWIEGLIKDKKLGTKSGAGIYRKQGKDIYVFDATTGNYRPREKKLDAEVKKLIRGNGNGIAGALLKLQSMKSPQAQFLWDLHREMFIYASHHLASFGESVRDADRALVAGFGWEIGIFELWQKVGKNALIEKITNDIASGSALTSTKLPEWVVGKVAGGEFYTPEGASSPTSLSTSPSTSGRVALPTTGIAVTGIAVRQERSAQYLKELGNSSPVLFENEGMVAHEMGDDIIAISHKTKFNVLSYTVIEGYHAVLDIMEKRGGAIVIHQLTPHFGAGANLAEILVAAKTGKIRPSGAVGGLVSGLKSKAAKLMDDRLPDVSNMPPLSVVIPRLQDLCMRLKHGPNPVVACVEGLALGGCCEVILHCDRVVAAVNSYIGLVEIGVGLLPGGAGTKEMSRRAAEQQQGTPTLAFHIRYLEQILMASVSESAYRAQAMGYLRPQDSIIANPDEIFYTGSKIARSLLESDYRPVKRAERFPVIGSSGYATVLSQVENMHQGNFISNHDELCAKTIAGVFCGGSLDAGETVTADYQLQQECEAFLNLLETEKTQERIVYMLKNNKPLRN